MSDLKSLLICVLLLVITWSVTNINQKQIISGSSLEAEYLSPPRLSKEVVVPYKVDTSNILAALRRYRFLYYSFAAFHAVYLGLK